MGTPNVITRVARKILFRKDPAPADAGQVIAGTAYSLQNCEGFYHEEFFNELIVWERKRTERSRKPFLLVLLDVHRLFRDGLAQANLELLGRTLNGAMREIDIKGWYLHNHVMGIICPDVGLDHVGVVVDKVWSCVRNTLTPKAAERIRLSCIPFPQQDEPDRGQPEEQAEQTLYPELSNAPLSRRCALALKRSLDIAGSLALLCLSAPVFIVIPLVIRLSSRGPVLFRQQRVGLGGRSFTFLKFRSMYVNNDNSIHRQYVTDFIKAQNSVAKSDTGKFKLTNDPRVTPIGRFIRKTSLDELPQLINVLRGEMSLVGPRPPIPYEVREYDVWHRRRVMEIKPGITGPWQVYGRSSTTFDTMVRMDIRYIENWSFWMDIRLLLRTPLAVFAGKGAC